MSPDGVRQQQQRGALQPEAAGALKRIPAGQGVGKAAKKRARQQQRQQQEALLELLRATAETEAAAAGEVQQQQQQQRSSSALPVADSARQGAPPAALPAQGNSNTCSNGGIPSGSLPSARAVPALGRASPLPSQAPAAAAVAAGEVPLAAAAAAKAAAAALAGPAQQQQQQPTCSMSNSIAPPHKATSFEQRLPKLFPAAAAVEQRQQPAPSAETPAPVPAQQQPSLAPRGASQLSSSGKQEAAVAAALPESSGCAAAEDCTARLYPTPSSSCTDGSKAAAAAALAAGVRPAERPAATCCPSEPLAALPGQRSGSEGCSGDGGRSGGGDCGGSDCSGRSSALSLQQEEQHPPADHRPHNPSEYGLPYNFGTSYLPGAWAGCCRSDPPPRRLGYLCLLHAGHTLTRVRPCVCLHSHLTVLPPACLLTWLVFIHCCCCCRHA